MKVPRFSIGMMLLTVGVAAGISWLCASAPTPSAIVAGAACMAIPAALAIGPWSTLRGDRRRAAWVLGGAMALLVPPLAWLGVFSLHYLTFVYKYLIALFLLPLVFGAGAAWAGAASAPGADRRRSPVAACATVALLFAIPISMLFSSWPMWAAFRLSRPSLDRLADRVASGEVLAGPEWAGLFRVRKIARADVGAGNVALVVENDSTGHTWLVRAASPETRPAIPPPLLDTYPIEPRGRWWFHQIPN